MIHLMSRFNNNVERYQVLHKVPFCWAQISRKRANNITNFCVHNNTLNELFILLYSSKSSRISLFFLNTKVPYRKRGSQLFKINITQISALLVSDADRNKCKSESRENFSPFPSACGENCIVISFLRSSKLAIHSDSVLDETKLTSSHLSAISIIV